MTTKTNTKTSTKTAKATEGQAIKDYLTFLKDPKALIDSDAVAKTRAALESEVDPLKQMVLFDQLCDLEHPSREIYENGFVSSAPQWVEANAINNPASVFLDSGVPRNVIARAFKLERTRTSRATIEAAIPSGVFTINDVAVASGATYGAASKTVKDLVETGVLVSRGTVDHAGPGRSPQSFEAVE